MIDDSNNPKVSIIILNYNAGDLLLNCVESVFKTPYYNIEVIVVDNASADNSHHRCKEQFDKIKLIENKQNLGYCEGNNVGIREATGEFIIILNPDTIVTQDWISELISAYKKHGEGLYQPKIISLYEKDVIQSTGNMIHLFGFGFARNKGMMNSTQIQSTEQIGYASGTCLFTSQNTIKKIGLLDSFLFLYHDDLDLGWRAAQLGIKSYYVPLATIYHAESYSLKWSSKKFFWLERNRRYCLLTHYSSSTYKKMRPYLWLVEMLVWIFYISKGFVNAKIRAELDIIKNKKQILEKQQELESKKMIPDSKLIESFPDEIFVPRNVSDGVSSRIFNLLLRSASQKAKNRILHK